MHQTLTQGREIQQPPEDSEHHFVRVDLAVCPIIGFITLEAPDRFR
jgi:hypothetical protein